MRLRSEWVRGRVVGSTSEGHPTEGIMTVRGVEIKPGSDNALSTLGGTSDGFETTPVGLFVTGEPTFEQWAEMGRALQRYSVGIQWAVGDWLNYGERKYGEMYTAAVELTDFGYKTLRNIKRVAAAVELSRRRDNLPFSLHAEVSPLPPAQQVEILERANRERLSKMAVRKLVGQRQRAEGRRRQRDATEVELLHPVEPDAGAFPDGGPLAPSDRTSTGAEKEAERQAVANTVSEALRTLAELCETGGPVAVSVAAACRRLGYDAAGWWRVLRVAVGLDPVPQAGRPAPWDVQAAG